MALSYKTFGQDAPSAAANTDLFSVSSGHNLVIARLVACNRGTTAGNIRVAVRVAGTLAAAPANKDYLYYDLPLAALSAFEVVGDITLGSTDYFTVYASSANFSFTGNGGETDTDLGYKVLGQLAPSATMNTTLYTVPSATEAITGGLFVCNRSATATKYRIAVRPAGAAIANKHYIRYDETIEGNNTHLIPHGLCLATTDVITVYDTAGTLSFNLFGRELT